MVEYKEFWNRSHKHHIIKIPSILLNVDHGSIPSPEEEYTTFAHTVLGN